MLWRRLQSENKLDIDPLHSQYPGQMADRPLQSARFGVLKEVDQGKVIFQMCVRLKHVFVVFLQVQKKNFIENIIPIITSLKTVLEKNKIPALRELMNYLRVNEELALWAFPPQLHCPRLIA